MKKFMSLSNLHESIEFKALAECKHNPIVYYHGLNINIDLEYMNQEASIFSIGMSIIKEELNVRMVFIIKDKD